MSVVPVGVFVAADLDESDATRSYDGLLNRKGRDPPDVEPYIYVSHFVTMMKLTRETEVLAVKLMDAAIEMNLTEGNNPAAIASVVTYIACRLTGEKKALSDFYKVLGATKASIGKYYRNVMDSLFITLEI